MKALSYLEELEQLTKRIEKSVNKIPKLRKELSEIDQYINEAYHVIENTDFNARDGFGSYKNLQSLLRKRRLIKHELQALETIAGRAEIKKYSTTVKNVKTSIQTKYDNHLKHRKSGWGMTIDDVVEGIYDEVQ